MFKTKQFAYTAVAVMALGILVGGRLAQPLLAQTKAALVRNVDNAALQPVQLPLTLSADQNQDFYVTSVNVPSGKRLVVQKIRVHDFSTGGNGPGLLYASALAMGSLGTISLTTAMTSTFPGTEFGEIDGPFYVDGNSSLNVQYLPGSGQPANGSPRAGVLLGYYINP